MLKIYKASAGSGKTFTLAAQYIANVLKTERGNHRYILAVTFTNKATAEMKSRILQHLYAIAYGVDAENSFLLKVKSLMMPVVVSDEVLRARAAEALSSILDNYDDFGVTTIDSFFQQLLTSLAHDIGLAASIAVDIGDTDVVKRAVQRLIAEAAVDNQLAEWISGLSRDRIVEGKSWKVAEDLTKLAGELLKERYLSREHGMMDDRMTDDFVNNYCQKLKQVSEQACEILRVSAEAFEAKVIDFGGYDRFKNGKKSLIPFVNRLKQGEMTRPTDTVLGLGKEPSVWHYAASNKYHEQSLEASEVLMPELTALLTERETCEWQYNTVMLSVAWIRQLRLMRRVEQELRAINEAEGRFMLAYTPKLFHELLFKADAQFVLERAGVNYHHIMIDEFQDTSPMQWQNMRELLVGSLASGNDCLIVGDVKQGIYRFRGGDWTTLQRASSKYRESVMTLQQNFRSGAVIVDFNNRLFAQMAACMDRQQQRVGEPLTELSEIYSDVAQTAPRGNYGRVQVNFVNLTTAAQSTQDSSAIDLQQSTYNRERDIYDTICRLVQSGIAYSDMVILVSKDKEAGVLANAFESFGAAFQIVSEKAFELQSSLHVQLIIFALRLLHRPSDTIARHTLKRYVADELGLEGLPAKYERLIGGAYRRYSLMQNIMTIVEAFGLSQVRDENGYVFGFLEVVRQWCEENASVTEDFLRDWEDKLCTTNVVPDSVDAVRVMTIHKSKGLDFKVVLMPYVDWQMFELKTDFARMDFLWCNTIEEREGEVVSRLPIAVSETLPMLPVPLLASMEKSVYHPEFDSERHDQRIEHLNLLYVACTRACSDLYIWADTKTDSDGQRLETVGDLMYDAVFNPCQDVPVVFDPEVGQTCSVEKYERVEVRRCVWQESENSAAIVETLSRDKDFDNPLEIKAVEPEDVPLVISNRMPPVIMVAETE